MGLDSTPVEEPVQEKPAKNNAFNLNFKSKANSQPKSADLLNEFSQPPTAQQQSGPNLLGAFTEPVQTSAQNNGQQQEFDLLGGGFN
jgi:hypothetical protein